MKNSKSTARAARQAAAVAESGRRLHYRIKEGLMLALLVVASVLLLALWSYSPQDPGFSMATAPGPVRNAIGPFGAWLASFLFDWLGYTAYALPLLMLAKVADLFVRRHQVFRALDVMLLARLVSLGVLMISVSALLHVQFGMRFSSHVISAGGILGQALGNRSELQLGVTGSTLLLLGMALFSLTVFTELSWFWLMEFFGRLVLDLCDLLSGGIGRWFSQRMGRSVARLDQAQRKAPQVRGLRPKARDLRERLTGASEPEMDAPVAAAKAPLLQKAQSALSERTRAKPRRGVARPLASQPEDSQPFLDDLAAQLSGLTAAAETAPATGRAGAEPPLVTAALDDAPPAGEGKAAARRARVEPQLSAAPAAAPVTAPTAAAPAAAARPQPRAARPAAHPPVASAAPGSLPPLSLLDPAEAHTNSFSPAMLESMGRLLEAKLGEFGVEVEVVAAHPGPVITRFEIQPAPGIKVSRITNLAKDLARSMAVLSVRVVEVIPGKTTVGIEVPNEKRQIVRLIEVLSTPEFSDSRTPVPLALGHDIGGHPVSADLARMPHLLVAGTTGSGKSVGVNAMLLSILFKSTPQEVRLIMIDPKMLELSIYEGIPHLLCPVVTDMKEAANALRWCVAEMDRRYKLMAAMGVRNLAGFNRKVTEAQEAGKPLTDPLFRRETPEDEPALLQTLPTIVVVIDEFADMMMIVGKKVEELIARIAQKARAAGIHLILATQRPSVDVITGLIKANIPTRIAFQVSSKIDSRTILDQGGAEQLLGHGDMLYLPPGTGLPVRVHGAFVSDDEVHRLVEAWKERGAPDYIEDILNGTDDSMPGSEGGGSSEGGEGSESDPLYDEAVRFVTESRRASISSVQRKLKIGYNRAARMIEAMEMAGVVTSMNSNGSREVIAPAPVRD